MSDILRDEACTKANITECQELCNVQYFGNKNFYNILTNKCEEYLGSCPQESSLDKSVNKCVKPDGSVVSNETEIKPTEKQECGENATFNLEFGVCTCNEGWFQNAESGLCTET